MRPRWIVIAALLLASCASTGDVPKGVVASGAALEAVGNTFVSTAQAMAGLCKAEKISRATCDGFGSFVKTFQPSYAAAVKAWGAASDAKSAQQAVEQVLTLSNQLTAYAVQAAQQAAGGGK